MKRRDFLKSAAGIAGVTALGGVPSILAGCSGGARASIGRRVMVLGLDGMDPGLLGRFVEEGIMPNFSRLMRSGTFSTLGTSLPPQSPVAWSDFTTGMGPGGHGIFDFLHRDPATMFPFFSGSEVKGAEKTVTIGSTVIPLSGGKTKNLRRGTAFWELLDDSSVPVTIVKMPANFPPVPSRGRTLSGLGTPDILGTYGVFSYFTDDPPEGSDNISGGHVYPVYLRNHSFKAALRGPTNTFRTGSPKSECPFQVFRDPERGVLKIVIADQEVMLQEGEWSDWVRVKYDMHPVFDFISGELTGICRFYAKEIHPHMKLYVTPVNIDPADPALPISTPAGYSKELAEAIGPFYTQGFPEDTKALSNGILSAEEYLEQADIVLQERLALLDYELDNFSDGFFFFYFSSLDQNSHIMWSAMDPRHPLHDPDAPPKVKQAIRNFYREMDSVLARVMGSVDSRTTLYVISDHGFAPFYREFNLNSWLLERGYLSLIDPSAREHVQFLSHVDWRHTKAYGLGLNGLYVNTRGREKRGVVNPVEAEVIADQLIDELQQITDPQTGVPLVVKAYKAKEAYRGEHVDLAPDVILGYQRGFRVSDESAVGEFPSEVIRDRTDKWSGDHCIHPPSVGGVFFSNRTLEASNPRLKDMAPTILRDFGIDPLPEMEGKAIT